MTQPAVIHGKKRKRFLTYLTLCAAGLALNLLLSWLASAAGIPLYLDSAGTILTAVLGGYLPGMVVGYVTNLVKGLFITDPNATFYNVLNVLIAALAAFLSRRDWFRTFRKALCSVPLFALIGGGLGALLTWGISYRDFGAELSSPLALWIHNSGLQSKFASQLSADLLLDLADKLVTVIIVVLILKVIPAHIQRACRLRLWQQKPMTAEDRAASRRFRTRKMSLRPKLMLLIMVSMLVVAVVTTGIGYNLYKESLLKTQAEMGCGVTRVLISSMDPDRVDEYLALGDSAPGYKESETAMAHVRDSSDDIEYVYVYQIREDGCHVVFDPDTADEEGYDPGSVQPFDEDFSPVLADLLEGKAIDPVESRGQYGWLYTIYTPVHDSAGRTVCYAGVDISMESVATELYAYITKVLSLFVSFIAILMALFLLLADSGIIMPINAMSLASSRFAFDSAEQRNAGVEQLRSLRIQTGDEIENLYSATVKTTEDSVRYIAETQEKSETIARMQENLITVLADMVESRDQFTGNHIRNTSSYAAIIMEELKKEGIYTDQLTDDFVQNVIHSAPLHDIGKIRISDTILNKPGKLTDEEFDTMKLHTVYGREVLLQAEKVSSDNSYLKEAENLANYHHEKWNGKGYPTGLAGEEIPLSARIMAVADVFDALVSKRSYKDPFPFEKAMDIIREGSGSHFDPYVAEAFIRSEDKVRRVLAEKQEEK